jgi:hypothetical protein
MLGERGIAGERAYSTGQIISVARFPVGYSIDCRQDGGKGITYAAGSLRRQVVTPMYAENSRYLIVLMLRRFETSLGSIDHAILDDM